MTTELSKILELEFRITNDGMFNLLKNHIESSFLRYKIHKA